MARPKSPSSTDSGSVSLTEAATLLGVAPEVLLEALVEHGVPEAEARQARLLTAEVDRFRRQLQGGHDRAKQQLAALLDELD